MQRRRCSFCRAMVIPPLHCPYTTGREGLASAVLEFGPPWLTIWPMSAMNDEIASLTFEDALRALEETVALLEAGSLSLEESLALFERGKLLAERCNRLLDGAQLRVEMLTEGGEIVDVSDAV